MSAFLIAIFFYVFSNMYMCVCLYMCLRLFEMRIAGAPTAPAPHQGQSWYLHFRVITAWPSSKHAIVCSWLGTISIEGTQFKKHLRRFTQGFKSLLSAAFETMIIQKYLPSHHTELANLSTFQKLFSLFWHFKFSLFWEFINFKYGTSLTRLPPL